MEGARTRALRTSRLRCSKVLASVILARNRWQFRSITGRAPQKPYSCKGLSERAEYGTNLSCCVHDSARAGFPRKRPRNWIAVPGSLVQPGDPAVRFA
jgi:hypothetical protein